MNTIINNTNPTEVTAIKFANGGEEDGPGRHVEAHGKGLRSKQRLHQTFGKQYLDCLLYNGKQTCQMELHMRSISPSYGNKNYIIGTVYHHCDHEQQTKILSVFLITYKIKLFKWKYNKKHNDLNAIYIHLHDGFRYLVSTEVKLTLLAVTVCLPQTVLPWRC